MDLRKFIVDSEMCPIRVDLYLSEINEDLSRSRVQELIKEGRASILNKKIKSNLKLQGGEVIDLEVPELSPLEIKPENIDINIVYEDSDIIVVNKARGMVVHPANGNESGTLVNALLYHCKDLSGINGVIRPGIVHRIDKDTTGLLVVAKNDKAHVSLAEQIKEHSINRIYNAIVHGMVAEPRGIVDCPIGRHPVQRKQMAVVADGRNAVTHYKVLERYQGYTLLELKLETGRTHQIRVHMSYLGYPVVADPLYSKRKYSFRINGQALHAKTLGFNHPTTGEYMEFNSEFPDDMQEILKELQKDI